MEDYKMTLREIKAIKGDHLWYNNHSIYVVSDNTWGVYRKDKKSRLRLSDDIVNEEKILDLEVVNLGVKDNKLIIFIND